MLKIINAHKTYNIKPNNLHALNNVSLEIKKEEIFGIIGLSGAGKSTLLRSIAFLEKLDSGKILIDGIDITTLVGKEKREFLRNIGVVFQGYNLLMQKNVFDNIALPLKIAHIDKEKIKERVNELIGLVGLSGKEKSYPSKLSGGQKQRVAIARALVLNPKVLLLDEITSALDPVTTKQILELLKEINKVSKVTMVLITHEMGVVSSICDKVAVINYGEIVEEGRTKEVIANPQSEIAKMLLGKE